MRKSEIYPDNLETFITETNARFLGINTTALSDKAGELLASELVKKYGKNPSYAFICGLGNNGADGMAAARHLVPQVVGTVTVYLAGRQKDLSTDAARHQWQELQALHSRGNFPHMKIKQDVFAPDIESHHVIVECLAGTGRNGELKKRFRDIVKRCTHFRQHMVALDTPVPGYTWDLSLSVMYPKTPDAHTIDLELPPQVYTYTGPGEVKALFQPRRDSYKSQNGKLLIIGDSTNSDVLEQAARAALTYTNYVYYFSVTPSEELADLMAVPGSRLAEIATQADAILIGNSWEDNMLNQALLNHLLANFPDQKLILDSAAIGMADISLVKKHGNVLFVPQRSDLPRLLQTETRINLDALEGRLRRFAAENSCFINLTGSNSLLFGRNSFDHKPDMRINRGHYTSIRQDASAILTGITAAFATKNDLWLSLLAGSFISTLAIDIANKEYGSGFTATDTIACLLQAWQYCQEF